MKPLVLFSSLAVLCAGGLLALSYEGWHDDPSALTSLSSESKRVKINPGVAVSNPPAAQPAPETKSAATKKAEEEKIAAVEPKQTETKPAGEAAPSVKPEEPQAKPEEPQAKPEVTGAETKGASFDIVRVEEDGSAVLAGRAEPGDKVRLLINEKVAGETQANDRGEWVIIPDNSMPAGAHQMQIETENAAGVVKRAEQSVALTVPDQPGTQPLIVLSETAKPSKVLQKPAAPQVEQAETTQETPPADTSAAPVVVAQKEKSESDAPSAQSTGQSAPETETAALEPSDATKAPSSVPTEPKLAVDVVDYDEAGLTTFSGRATPGNRVRVYVDNRPVGDAIAADNGTWSFTAGSEITPGPHTLRTDELAASGNVSARIELPFFRESSERIASLQAQRKVASEENSAKPPAAGTESDTTSNVAEADASAGSDPVAEPVKPAEVKEPKTEETVVAAKPEDEPAATQEEKVATQQTSGLKADAETVSPPVAADTSGSSASEQTAAVETAAEPAKPETSQQTAAVETATEPAKPETTQEAAAVETATEPAKPEATQQTAAVETATEPAKPETTQQAAAVETATEPAKPETNQQIAAIVPADDQEKPVQETLKPEPLEPAKATETVETAAVTPEPAKTEAAAPATGQVVIQPGNNLWQISRVIYGKGRQYTVIYEANKTQIRDPDKIYPGQIFETPGSDAPESIDPSCRKPLAECQ